MAEGRILLVDDEDEVVVELRAALEKEGYRTAIARWVEQAQTLCALQVFDVAVIDLRPPGDEILLFVEEVRARWPRTAVLVTSTYSSIEAARRVFQAGVHDYLLKPIVPEELISIIGQVLQQRPYLGEIAELQRLTEGFIETTTHDLKSGLASLYVTARLILQRLETETLNTADLLQEMRGIQAGVGAMVARLDTIIDATRIRAGVLELQRQSCSLNACIAAALDRLDPPQRARVEMIAPADDPLAGHWDEARIRQVIGNLLTNAVRFSPPGTPVRLEVRRRRDMAEVSVIDEGIAITPGELSTLFQGFPWNVTEGTRTARSDGLSLYVCRGIVIAHGGRIWALSVGGRGATFRFTLPLPSR